MAECRRTPCFNCRTKLDDAKPVPVDVGSRSRLLASLREAAKKWDKERLQKERGMQNEINQLKVQCYSAKANVQVTRSKELQLETDLRSKADHLKNLQSLLACERDKNLVFEVVLAEETDAKAIVEVDLSKKQEEAHDLLGQLREIEKQDSGETDARLRLEMEKKNLEKILEKARDQQLEVEKKLSNVRARRINSSEILLP